MKTVWRLVIEEPKDTMPWMRENARLAIGWGEISDLRDFASAEAIADQIKKRNASAPNHIGRGLLNEQHGSHSLWEFVHNLGVGHLVIISAKVDEKKTKRIFVMEALGEYEYLSRSGFVLNYQHQRKARVVDLNPDALWERAEGKRIPPQEIRRAFVRCPNDIE